MSTKHGKERSKISRCNKVSRFRIVLVPGWLPLCTRLFLSNGMVEGDLFVKRPNCSGPLALSLLNKIRVVTHQTRIVSYPVRIVKKRVFLNMTGWVAAVVFRKEIVVFYCWTISRYRVMSFEPLFARNISGICGRSNTFFLRHTEDEL